MHIRQLAIIVCLLLTQSVLASPEIQHWQTNNGAKVLFVNSPELPMLDIRVVFDAGSARDGYGLSGQAVMTNTMLSEGAGGYSADDIATAFESVGAQFSQDAQRDMAVLSLRTLTTSSVLSSALSMFKVVLTAPDFNEADFQRIKKQVQLAITAEKQSPAAIGRRTFYQQLYQSHPYATMPIGHQESVAVLTRDEIQQFYQQYYVARNATIVLVGAIEQSKAKTIANTITAGLVSGEKAKELPKVAALTKAQTVHIPFPSQQTHIFMGQPGISRDDPDYFPLYVGNHILGGSGLISQISRVIREEHGLAYSAYSYYRPMRQLGPYQFGLQTQNKTANEALHRLKKTVTDFIRKGPSQADLEAAKQNIMGGFALRIDSNRKITDYIAMIGFYGLPLDYLMTFKKNVEAVTAQDIQTAYQRRMNSDKMVTVLVGEKKQ